MSLLPLFNWLEATLVGRTINESTYIFAVIQAGHLLSLAVLGGAVLLVDLRLLGVGFRSQPVAYLARAAHPWLVGGTIGIIVTGTLMFSSLAGSRYYWNEAFWWKMYWLIAAIIFTFVIRQRIALGDPGRSASGLAKAVAAISALSWLTVGIMGRAIGFV
jgi:hypothetical protein